MTMNRRRFLRDSSLVVSAGALGTGLIGCGRESGDAASLTASTSRPDVDLLASYWTIAGKVVPATGPEYSSFDFRDRVEAISRVGFRGMGIWHADLYKVQETYSLEDMRKILDDNGIVHVELEFLFDWYLDGDKKAASDREKAMFFNAAEVLGARHLKVGDFFNTPVELDQCTESFAALCGNAADIGINILFEVMPFAMINDYDDAVKMCEDAGAANGGLMIDTWHMVKMGVSNERLAQTPKHVILGVELNDGWLETPQGMDLATETTEQRQFPGEGEFDMQGFMEAIFATGYDGPYGVEVIKKANRELPLDDVVQQAWDTSVAQFA